MKQGKSLQQLASEIEAQRTAKKDYLAPTNKVHFISPEQMTIESVAPVYAPSDLFTQQLATHYGVGSDYSRGLRTRLPNAWSDLMNAELSATPTPRMIRTLNGTARAFLSNSYERVDHSDVAEAILSLIAERGRGDWEIVSSEITDKRMYIKVLTPTILTVGPRHLNDEIRSGFEVVNSEVGQGTYEVNRFSVRLRCLNGMIGEVMISRKHVGQRYNFGSDGYELKADTHNAISRALMLQTRDALMATVDETRFGQYVARLTATTERKIEGDIEQSVVVLQKQADLSEKERGSVLQHLIKGGDLTQWGMANAVTAAAQDDDLTYDRATELEELGGRIIELAPAKWGEISTAQKPAVKGGKNRR